ncbi:hypothetical protein RESH_02844 [Rhodopirellula europaea SH398]|uniref:Uncharacterized protein n=1 Tax=Rhodopirellula europaea SH398 TaxID=1263868 RepID=M5SK33_9BACT|nr:hypothetical protein RESH_02844 [Rhodopirellula europaea SH398]
MLKKAVGHSTKKRNFKANASGSQEFSRFQNRFASATQREFIG